MAAHQISKQQHSARSATLSGNPGVDPTGSRVHNRYLFKAESLDGAVVARISGQGFQKL